MKRLPVKYWRQVQEVYRRQDCLVWVTARPWKVGDIFASATISGVDYKLPQPFCVVGPATKDEYIAQGGVDGKPLRPQYTVGYFCKTVTE